MNKKTKHILLISGISLLVALVISYYLWQTNHPSTVKVGCGYWNNYCHPESDGPYDSY